MSTLILTHEQADFDAVASVWAAHRLYPSAAPVLPRRINRNVRAFLTLYGQHFSFSETEDLPRRYVDKVVVVDAQSTSSVRGMTPKTEVVIIDHHEPSASTVGANVTLLVERLAEARISISPVEATLFLLGIYEDTGALSYLTTTPRDVRAAAFLLESGAHLDTVRDFLQHPLTDGQKALFDQLLAAAETHSLKGQSIVIAAIDAGDSDEELSALAHKLRDTFEASATFMLVGLRGHELRVQLIARSTSDSVDAGAAAARFGGGGHNRAAAALIRNQSLSEARAMLLAILPECIRPAVTVREIMSRGVQTLEMSATIRDASERMRRYGYEGYPVVVNGRVMGLLTRRAVDRALTHHLGGQPISTIMEAGELTVSPDDSLEHLQRLMTAHGWGQVPVVEDGAITGIVTRTDLLKRLAAPPPQRQQRSLAEALAGVLPESQLMLLRQISDAAAALNVSIFLVGGFVRDLLLRTWNRAIANNGARADFDVVVEGDAIALARHMATRLGGQVTAHARFGTAKWRLPANAPLAHLDFVSARTEFYAHPSALPEVEHASIKLDLHRRDFTINTLALSLDRHSWGEVMDFWGGERDLRDGLIRVLHSISFVDDPTRILRAVRFEQRFHFRIEARTAELIAHALPLLNRVSGDRIRHELDLILHEAEPERHLARLAGLGILADIHPDLAADGALARQFAALRGAAHYGDLSPGRRDGAEQREPAASRQPPIARWAAWLSNVPVASLDSVLGRLSFPARHAETIRQVSALRILFAGLSPDSRFSDIHAQLESFDSEPFTIALALADDEPLRRHLLKYQSRLRTCRPITTGEDLKALGLPPGPRYREILARLQAAYLDGEIDSPGEERALLHRLVEQEA